VLDIGVLRDRARSLAPEMPAATQTPRDARVVGVVEYRDGRVIDLIRQVLG
jgi:citrate lyase alpha subunit